MRNTRLLVLLAVAVSSGSGCRMLHRFGVRPHPEIVRASHAVPEQPGERTIHLVGHGWHTGLVLNTADISPEIWPEAEAFQMVDFVELGWGDEGFYTADAITPGLVAKAACRDSCSRS